MEFVRQIVNGNTLEQSLNLPPSFRNIQVEVIVFPVENAQTAVYDTPAKPVTHSAFGRLNAYANPSLIPREETAWEEAAAEKHAIP
jgi:hypothetical protein